MLVRLKSTGQRASFRPMEERSWYDSSCWTAFGSTVASGFRTQSLVLFQLPANHSWPTYVRMGSLLYSKYLPLLQTLVFSQYSHRIVWVGTWLSIWGAWFSQVTTETNHPRDIQTQMKAAWRLKQRLAKRMPGKMMQDLRGRLFSP